MNNYLQGVDLSTNTATYKNERDKIYEWWINDRFHRDDGPAYIDNINKLYYWFIKGKNKTDEITKWLKDNEIDLINMTLEEKVLLKVAFG